MKKFIYLILTLMIVACSSQPQKPVVVETPPETLPSEPLPRHEVHDVYDYVSSLQWVKKLSEASNCTLKKKSFKDRVESVLSFDYSNDNGKQVYSKLVAHKCTARTYRTKNPWSSVIATTYSSNKKDFYLNTRKNPRPYPSMINTSFHECLHNVGYGHGDNSPNGKQNSVNHKVGKIAQEESEGCY